MISLPRGLWLVAALLLAPGSNATASVNNGVLLDELTWTELRDAIVAGKTTIIVPIGGTEQNGPHMTLGKHNVRVKALAERIAGALGNALVAPVVAYVPEGSIDPPTAHMRFPGTISVPERAFEAVLEGAARSFKRHGFRDIVFLGDHGGYQTSEQTVAARLNREWANGSTRVIALVDYYRLASTRYAEVLRSRGYTDAEIGTHAGLADTSLALAVDPGLVRKERLSDKTPLGTADGLANRGGVTHRCLSASRSGSFVAAFRSSRSSSLALIIAGALIASAAPPRAIAQTPVPAPSIATVPGMPPVIDPSNLYSEAGAGRLSAAVAGDLPRVYVPNLRSNDVYVIDPATLKVVDRFKVGFNPQHVVPSWDLSTLWVANNAEHRTDGSLTPIDPKTGKPGLPVSVDDPYNMYFAPASITPISRSTAAMRSSRANFTAAWRRSISSIARCWATSSCRRAGCRRTFAFPPTASCSMSPT
jgi:YVTN family beta-propeller protein